MKITTQLLLDAVQLVQSGVAQKEVVQQSNCFVFNNNRIYTYNDEIAISHPFEIDINGAVLADELFGLLNKTKQKELDISQTDKGLSIKGAKFKANINISSEIVLPIDEISETGTFFALPKDFTEALKFCLFSCSNDMTQPVLTCVHAFDGAMESSDNFRITVRYFEDSDYFKSPILIPSNAANTLLKFDVVEYSSNKGWLHFKTTNDTIFSCRTYENMEFPDISEFINIEGEKITLPNDLAKVLARAEVFSSDKFQFDERVTVIIKEGKLIIKAKGDAGWFEEFCRIRYKGEDKRFEVHPKFLSYIFELCKIMEVGDKNLRFEGKNHEFVHVVSLLV